MVYWLYKWLIFVPLVTLLFRPRIEGADNVPASGPAILASNHISAGDTYLLPTLVRRRMVFAAKAELFQARDLKGRLLGGWLRSVGMVPMERSGGRASAGSMDTVYGELRRGALLGLFPEGTRSPDGRLYKGKTGVARLVLQAGVPVIPVAMVGTELVPLPLLRIPWMHRPTVRIGRPLDFSAYEGAGSDRDVLRWVTDQIMAAIQQLSGQPYVDAYGATAKILLGRGEPAPEASAAPPGAGVVPPPRPVGTAA